MIVICGNKKTAKRLTKVLTRAFPNETVVVTTDSSQEIRLSELPEVQGVARALKGAGYPVFTLL